MKPEKVEHEAGTITATIGHPAPGMKCWNIMIRLNSGFKYPPDKSDYPGSWRWFVRKKYGISRSYDDKDEGIAEAKQLLDMILRQSKVRL